MSHLCQISTCKSNSIAICFCCQQNLCQDHLIEHDYLIQTKFNHLNQQLNQLTQQFDLNNREKFIENLHNKLNQWRLESHETIEKFYRNKTQEFNQYIKTILDQHEETILDLKLQLAKMINIQHKTNENLQYLTKNLRLLENDIQQIEQISIEININPLEFNENDIQFQLMNSYQTNFLRLTSPNKILHRTPLSSDAITSNHQYLLIHQNSHLYLINKTFRIQYENLWPYDYIKDMCWSESLQCFFLLTSNQIYSVDDKLRTIEILSTIQGQSWQSCTCSKTSLYLTKDQWNSSIDEFSLTTSFEFVRNYQRIETKTNKQRIDHFEYHQGTIALLINDQTRKIIFLELRTIPTFDCLWFYQLAIDYSERKLTCCSFHSYSWIVADWQTSTIFHITKTGQLKQTILYDSQIHSIHLFDQKQLVISTDTNIHFHKL